MCVGAEQRSPFVDDKHLGDTTVTLVASVTGVPRAHDGSRNIGVIAHPLAQEPLRDGLGVVDHLPEQPAPLPDPKPRKKGGLDARLTKMPA